MEGFLGTAHVWVKALHIVAVMAWMAGLLYLPRLFVYHADTVPGSEQSETFKIMERRLLRGIVNPAFLFTVLFGVLLVLDAGPGLWSSGWWHVKLTAVLIMAGLHGFMSVQCRVFAEDRNARTARFYRIVNEVPAVLMVIIVIMAVARPF